jgi:hypothetical protein
MRPPPEIAAIPKLTALTQQKAPPDQSGGAIYFYAPFYKREVNPYFQVKVAFSLRGMRVTSFGVFLSAGLR